MSTEDAATIVCPACQGDMVVHDRLRVPVTQCQACHGIFLQRSSLADLIETENDWHVSRGPRTQPLPRITPDMVVPPDVAPPGQGRPARSFVDALFG
ncbi:hypothetical protein BH20ACT6_BH20ACT6_08220 [soil metagenome]